jgi:hypothetical protein
MFYLCTAIQGLPEKTKLVQLKRENVEELKPYVRSDDDIQWIENDKGEAVFGKSKV